MIQVREIDLKIGADLRRMIRETKQPNRVWLTVAVGHRMTLPVWWPKTTARELVKHINYHKQRAAAILVMESPDLPREWRKHGVRAGDLVIVAGLRW